MPTLAAAPAAFSNLDLTALTLGAREGTLAFRTLPGMNVLVRLMEMLTGVRFARPLINPHLEALRRSAAKLQRGRPLGVSEQAALESVGLTPAEASALLARIARKRRP